MRLDHLRCLLGVATILASATLAVAGETCTSHGECDDGLDCTLDLCLGDFGQPLHCENRPQCDDGDPCTADTCEATGCQNDVHFEPDWRPASYDDFVVFDPGTHGTLAALIDDCSVGAIFVPPGPTQHEPITIDRSVPLFLHGGNRMATTISAPHDDPDPLIRIVEAPLVNIAGIQLLRNGIPASPGSLPGVTAENTAPLNLEIQDTAFRRSSLQILGPATVRVQGSWLNGKGTVEAPLLIDHPEADVTVVGGEIRHYTDDLCPAPPCDPALKGLRRDVYQVRQKQGRLRIFGANLLRSVGRADIRIDSRSTEPHIIANNRSEGTAQTASDCCASSLLYVPDQADPALSPDVIVYNNAGDWPAPEEGRSHLADYNAAGTLWLVGNNAGVGEGPTDPPYGAGGAATGRAPDATIVALGNRLYDHENILPACAGRGILVGNQYQRHALESVHCDTPPAPAPPAARFVNPTADFSDYENAPPFPDLDLPQRLTRPRVNSALPGMIAADLYPTLQDALNAAVTSQYRMLFVPEATYTITSALHFLDAQQCEWIKGHACIDDDEDQEQKMLFDPQGFGGGAWIAGPDSETTKIQNANGSVLHTEHLAHATIQGLTFENQDPNDSTTTVQIENGPTNNVVHSTQIQFYDTRFTGGKHALAFCLDSPAACDGNLLVDSTFSGAEYGLAVGSFNALGNIVFGGTFDGNDYAMGHDPDRLSGGTWSVYGGTISGTGTADLHMHRTNARVWLFHDLVTSSETLLVVDPPSLPPAVQFKESFMVAFDQSTITPSSSGGPFVDFAATGGVTWSNSTVGSGEVSLGGTGGANYSLNLGSTFLASTTLGSDSLAFDLSDSPTVSAATCVSSCSGEAIESLCPSGWGCDESAGHCVQLQSCTDHGDCADGLSCTLDLCLADFGGPFYCRHTLRHEQCVDFDPCTEDQCAPEEATDPTGCIHSAPCKKSQVCDTETATCTSSCSNDGECSDGVDCTQDTCVGNLCRNTPNDALCDDHTSCSAGTCDATNDCTLCGGVCCNDADCDDSDDTTLDACVFDDVSTSCAHTPLDTCL